MCLLSLFGRLSLGQRLHALLLLIVVLFWLLVVTASIRAGDGWTKNFWGPLRLFLALLFFTVGSFRLPSRTLTNTVKTTRSYTIAMHRTPLSVRLIVAIILIVGSCGEGVRNEYQIDSGGSSSRCENTAWQGQLGQLRPHDLPRLRSFDVSKDRQQLTLSNGQQYDIATRQVGQINRVAASSQPDRLAFAASVSHVKHLVDVETVQQILQHLNHLPGPLDSDPDTVDGMPTYEIFVDSPDLGDRATTKRLDVDPSSVQARTGWRAALQQILQPVLHDRITPLVRHLYPEVCNTTHASRDCTPCFSLIRNYRHGQRQSHA